MTNKEILQKLRRLHTLLVLGKRSNNLAQAIRRAMDNIASWKHSVDELLARASIRQIFPNYGPKFIKIFEELIHTGNIKLIDQLQPEFDPFFCYLCEIPGIGETMARRMFFDRSIHSMDDLRIAYSNNVLQRIPAFGDSRLHTIEDILWKSQTGLSDNTDLSDDNLSSEDILMDIPVLANSPVSNSIQLDLFSSPAVSWSQASSSVHEITPANAANPSNDSPLLDPVSSTNAFPNEPIQSCEPDSELSMLNPITQDDDSRCDSFHKQNAAFLNRTNDASDSYHRQFVESNSSLFREEKGPQTMHKIESDQASDTNTAIQADERMADEIVSILDTPATPDPELKKELDAFIEEDLRTHGLCEENSVSQYAVLKSKNVQAEVIRANFIRTETIEAEFIILEDLAINSQFNGSCQIEDMEFPVIEADVIEANWVRAKEIHVRYLTAGIIIRRPKI